VGWTLGQLLTVAGQADQARQVLSDAMAAADMIGMPDLARQISQLLDSPPDAGEQT
jgi:alkylated DNA nucleotide flippase Atl1